MRNLGRVMKGQGDGLYRRTDTGHLSYSEQKKVETGQILGQGE